MKGGNNEKNKNENGEEKTKTNKKFFRGNMRELELHLWG